MIVDREERLKSTRGGLWRTALFWTPLAVGGLGSGVYFLAIEAAGDGNGWIVPGILLVVGALFAFQGVQALRDLSGGTQTMAGFITRRWWRLDLGTRSHYLRIDNNRILRTDRPQYLTVDQGDYVEIEYYPSSMIAVTVEKREAPEGAGPPDEPDEPMPREPDPLFIERE